MRAIIEDQGECSLDYYLLCFAALFCVRSLSLLATVDIMTLSFCCFAIIMLIEGDDGPKGPPPATPGRATRGSKSAEQTSKAGVANTGPVAKTAGAKRTQQGDLDDDPKCHAGRRSMIACIRSS